MASNNFTVVFDACVLFPAPLRDFLMHLAISSLFRAKWSEEIHTEWMENLLRKRKDLSRNHLEKTKFAMEKAVPDALVEKSRYYPLIKTLLLPDKDDRHVLALAIASQAQLIVTFNLKDFPSSSLKNFQVEAIHPDEFVIQLLDLSENTVVQAFYRQKSFLRNPPKSTSELLTTLSICGLAKSVEQLKNLVE